jgi:hypothetical protein
MARGVQVNTNPADLIERGEMNFNHLSVKNSDCDTIRTLSSNSLFEKPPVLTD